MERGGKVDRSRTIPVACAIIGYALIAIGKPIELAISGCNAFWPSGGRYCGTLMHLTAGGLLAAFALAIFAIYDHVCWRIWWLNYKLFGSLRGTWVYYTEGVKTQNGSSSSSDNLFAVVGTFYLNHSPFGADIRGAQVYYVKPCCDTTVLTLRGTWDAIAVDIRGDTITMVYDLLIVKDKPICKISESQVTSIESRYLAIHALKRAHDEPLFKNPVYRGKVSAATESGIRIVGDIYCERLTYGRRMSAQWALKKFLSQRAEIMCRVKSSGQLSLLSRLECTRTVIT